MAAIIIRTGIIFALFFLGSLFEGFFGRAGFALPLWFAAVTVWTLFYGFRSALFLVIPFLFIADLLWDGTIGALFFFGFALATLTTFAAVRIKTHSFLFQTFVYSMFIGFLSTCVPATFLFLKRQSIEVGEILLLLSTFFLHFIIALFFFPVFSHITSRVEKMLDTTYREQMKRIR